MHRAILDDVTQTSVTHGQTLFDLFGRAHERVDRKWGTGREEDFNRLVDRSSGERQDDQEVNIRIGRGTPVSVRAEQDDAQRLRLPGDPVVERLDALEIDQCGLTHDGTSRVGGSRNHFTNNSQVRQT